MSKLIANSLAAAIGACALLSTMPTRATTPATNSPNAPARIPGGQRMSAEEFERMREIWLLRSLQQRSGHHEPAQGIVPPIINGGPPGLSGPDSAPSTDTKSKKRKSASEKRAEAKQQAEEKKRLKKESREAAEKLDKRAKRVKPKAADPAGAADDAK